MEQVSVEELEKMHREWLKKGFKEGKIYPYPTWLIDRLRPYSYGGTPAPILLLVLELDNRFCYDRSLLMQLAFDNCKVIHADIETLRIKDGEKYAEHSYIETNNFGGDKTYVIDTSLGLIIEKEYYDEFEKPKVNVVYTKEECMQTYDVKQILAADFEQDKWALLMTLPIVEEILKNPERGGTLAYREWTLAEIEKLKKAINYDAMEREYEEDLAIMKEDPNALDDKFQILRDKYGREISRGGVPNPYYIETDEIDIVTPDDIDAGLDAVLNKRAIKKSIKLENEEYKNICKRATRRIKEIKKNPTQNFYDQPGEE